MIDNKSDIFNLSDSEDLKKFPIEVKKMSIQETKNYHLKRLFELSKKWRN